MEEKKEFEKHKKILGVAKKFFKEYYKLSFDDFIIYYDYKGFEVHYVGMVVDIDGDVSSYKYFGTLTEALKIAKNYLVLNSKFTNIILTVNKDIFDLNFNFVETKKTKKIDIKMEILNL